MIAPGSRQMQEVRILVGSLLDCFFSHMLNKKLATLPSIPLCLIFAVIICKSQLRNTVERCPSAHRLLILRGNAGLIFINTNYSQHQVRPCVLCNAMHGLSFLRFRGKAQAFSLVFFEECFCQFPLFGSTESVEFFLLPSKQSQRFRRFRILAQGRELLHFCLEFCNHLCLGFVARFEVCELLCLGFVARFEVCDLLVDFLSRCLSMSVYRVHMSFVCAKICRTRLQLIT